MRILIDIGHPAHVHLFRNFAKEMIKRGHKVLFTCRDREFVLYLLQYYGFEYRNFGKHYKTLQGKTFGIAKNILQMLDVSLVFKPDIYLSHGSTIASFASFIMKKPHIAFEDTFNMEQVRLSLPFTSVVLTGDYPHPDLGKKEIRYPGYHELAYLHPNVYTPDSSVLKTLGVNTDEKYAIIRFVGWHATHDIGKKGILNQNKLKLIEQLSKYIKVFISSERPLPAEFEQYQIKIKPEQLHDALYYAQLFIGEGATTASESAVLGTPAIYINSSQFGSTDDQAKYGLLFSYIDSPEDQEKALSKAIEIAQIDNIKSEFATKRQALLNNKIDVTAFLVWFIENYPDSEKEIRRGDFNFDRFK